MTPLDILAWIVIILVIIAIVFFILGCACDDIALGATIAVVFLVFAFGTFLIYAILWLIATALGIG